MAALVKSSVKYCVPALDIVKGGVTIAVALLQPELLPLIAPVFQILGGTAGLAEAILNRNQPNEIELLQNIQNAIETFKSETNETSQVLKNIILRADNYDRICYFIGKYASQPDSIDANSEICEAIKDVNHGLAFHLEAFQKKMTSFTGIDCTDSSTSWIAYLCEHCQKNPPPNDHTWGLQAAFQKFIVMLALQQQAVIILIKLEVCGAFEYLRKNEEQVDMFWDAFKEQWKSSMLKPLKPKPINTSKPLKESNGFGAISNNCFYRFVPTDSKGESALQEVNLASGEEKILATFSMKNSRKECRMCVYKGQLYTVDCLSKKLCSIDLSNYEKTTICSHRTFHKKSQMVCHEDVLYAVSRKGSLIKIDLKAHSDAEISSGWSKFTVLAVQKGKLYALDKARWWGNKQSFYTIDLLNSKRGSPLYSGHDFTTYMAMAAHGDYLYIIEKNQICAYRTPFESHPKVQTFGVSTEDWPVHLMSSESVDSTCSESAAELTLYLQVNSGDKTEIHLVKPLWKEQVSANSKPILNPEVKKDLRLHLKLLYDKLKVDYGKFVCALYRAVTNTQVRFEEFHLGVLSQIRLWDAAVKVKIEEAKSISRIFKILNDCCSVLNVSIFHFIMEANDIKADSESLKYSEHLKTYFSRHTISELCNAIQSFHGTTNGYSKKLTLKLDFEFHGKAETVLDLESAIFYSLSLYPSAFELVNIEDGCVILTYLIPEAVAEYFSKTSLTEKQKAGIDALQSVIWLKCEDVLLYTRDKESKRDVKLLSPDQSEPPIPRAESQLPEKASPQESSDKDIFDEEIEPLRRVLEGKLEYEEVASIERGRKLVDEICDKFECEEYIAGIERYSKYLKDIYCKDSVECDDKLKISPCSSFISLSLVNSTHCAKKSVTDDAKSLLSIDSLEISSNFVLVEGHPGIGKSTLCWELCRRWDTVASMRRFKLVILLKLQEEHIQKAESLNEFFCDDDKKLHAAVVDEVLKSNGEGVMFILDGFDELPDSVIKNQRCLLMRLIKGITLPRATRLVTTRPSAFHRDNCFPQKYQLVQIMGFANESEIYQFAEKSFEGQPDTFSNFKKFMLDNPVIKSLMYCPLNCAILTRAYSEDPKIVEVPKTMTQVYDLLVRVLIRRCMIEKNKWDLDQKIPSVLDSFPKEIKTDLYKVCEIAYKSLMAEKTEFSCDDIGENFQHLGLMGQTKKRFASRGTLSKYSFIHLSIRDFLAAFHVAHNHDLVQDISTFVNKHGFIKTFFNNFGKFLSGICCEVIVNSIEANKSNLNFSLIFGRKNILHLVSWCYEAQDTKILKYFKYSSISLQNSLDMYMFGYVLVHALTLWRVSTDASFDMLASSINDHAPDGKVSGCLELYNFFDLAKFQSMWGAITSLILNSEPLRSGVSLPNLREITLKFKNSFLPNHKFLLKVVNLKSINVLCQRVDVEETNPLSGFLATSSFENIVLAPGLEIEPLYCRPLSLCFSLNLVTLVKSALSCPSLKFFATNIPFFAVNLPSSTTELSFLVSAVWNISGKILFDCLCNIANLCKSLSVVRIVSVGDHDQSLMLTSEQLCMFLAILNHSAFCNPKLMIESRQCCYVSPSQLSCLSRSVRKGYDGSSLRRSKSLGDLSAPQVQRNSFEDQKYNLSCPDFLEMQSLHSLHPKLHEAVGSDRLYWRSQKPPSKPDFGVIELVLRHIRKLDYYALNKSSL